LTGEENLDMEFNAACGSDLMSDVMAYVKENVVLLTGLVNPQVIRTAEMMDIKLVVFIRGKEARGEDYSNGKRKKGIAIMTTNDRCL